VRLTAPATIEVPLPAGSPFLEGDRIALWSFDTASGLWREAGSAEVQPSTVRPGRLAVVGPAGRPGWWNVDRKIEAACLCTVFGEGYPPAPVETRAGGTCADGCAVVDLVPPTQATCVTGRAVDDIDAPIAGAIVEALDERGVSYGPVETDAHGFYTLRGLPTGPSVKIHATSQGRWGDLQAVTATEPGGACTLLPDLDCGGPS